MRLVRRQTYDMIATVQKAFYFLSIVMSVYGLWSMDHKSSPESGWARDVKNLYNIRG